MSVRTALSWWRARRRETPEDAGAAGYALIELVVVMGIFMLVLVVMLAALDSMQRTQKRNEALVDNQETVRQAVQQLARDLRSAQQLGDLGVATSYPYMVEFTRSNQDLFDATLTNGSSNLSSSSATFDSSYAGRGVSGGGITGGTTVSSVTNAHTIVLSAPATVTTTASGSVTISGSVGCWKLDSASKTLMRSKGPCSTPSPSVDYKATSVRNYDQGIPVFRYFRAGSATEMDPATQNSHDIAACSIHIHITVSADSNPGPTPFTSESDAELRNRLPGGIAGC
jgi:type II secretory pathway pseudopilin PulG